MGNENAKHIREENRVLRTHIEEINLELLGLVKESMNSSPDAAKDTQSDLEVRLTRLHERCHNLERENAYLKRKQADGKKESLVPLMPETMYHKQ